MYTSRLPGRRGRDGRFLLLAALLLIPGCGDSPTEQKRGDRADVTAPAPSVAAGDTVALAATQARGLAHTVMVSN